MKLQIDLVSLKDLTHIFSHQKYKKFRILLDGIRTIVHLKVYCAAYEKEQHFQAILEKFHKK